jgi:WD40 repeat protein
MKHKIIDDDEGSLDDLVKKARNDSELKRIMKGQKPLGPLEKNTGIALKLIHEYITPQPIQDVDFPASLLQVGVLLEDGSISLYPLVHDDKIVNLEQANSQRRIAFHPDKRIVVCCSGSGGLHAYNYNEINGNVDPGLNVAMLDEVYCAAFEPHGFYLIASTWEQLNVYEISHGNNISASKKFSVETEPHYKSLSWGMGTTWAAEKRSIVGVRDLKSNYSEAFQIELGRRRIRNEHRIVAPEPQRVTDSTFHPNKKIVAHVTDKGYLQMFDSETGEEKLCMLIFENPSAVAFSTCGMYLAVGDNRNLFVYQFDLK